MSYLLDSDVLIDFLKKKEPGYTLISSIIGKKLFSSVISWAEIQYGIKKSMNVSDKNIEFANFIKEFEIDILPVTQDIASKYVELRIGLEKKGQKIADFDLLIAATAIIKNLQLVTRNIRHFSRIPKLKIV